MARSRWAVAKGVYFVLVLSLLAALAFHRSESSFLFGYSARYWVVLIATTSLLGVPSALNWLVRTYGTRTILFALVPSALVAWFIYTVGTLWYYHSLRYEYDPFLQVQPARWEISARTPGDGVFRVLALGGSTTLFSEYPKQLEVTLQDRYPDIRIQVLNGGQPWWTTKHTLINYATYAESADADLVLVMHAINDLVRSCAPDDYAVGPYNDDWSHFFGPTIRTVNVPTPERRLRRWAYRSFSGYFTNREAEYGLEYFQSIDAFERNLERLVRYARADGSEIGLITQPSYFLSAEERDSSLYGSFGYEYCRDQVGWFEREWPSSESMTRAMEAFNDRVRTVARRRETILADAASAVPKTKENFHDDVHATEAGGRLLGDLVARAIVESGIVERAAAQASDSR